MYGQSTYPACDIERLVGRNVTGVLMSNEYLVFETDAEGGADQEPIAFVAHGDCCSYSYFYDFVGVRWLLENGPVLQAYSKDEWPQPDNDDCDTRTLAYGFVIVTESERFGEVTSLVSFRNDSNGYYGGWMDACDVPDDYEKRLKRLTENCFGLIHNTE